ncbi:MAG: hypothetical protein U0795_13150 [Pirellulales bacterium]
MNKAFLREPDLDGATYCPRCGSLGTPVGTATMDAHCRPESRSRLQETAWFCPYQRCDVAYFNQLETVITVAELQQPIYPKDLDAPLCRCFGFTLDDLEADLQEGTPTRIRALLAKTQSPDARCLTASPDGQCCLREIQRLYMKRRG